MLFTKITTTTSKHQLTSEIPHSIRVWVTIKYDMDRNSLEYNKEPNTTKNGIHSIANKVPTEQCRSEKWSSLWIQAFWKRNIYWLGFQSNNEEEQVSVGSVETIRTWISCEHWKILAFIGIRIWSRFYSSVYRTLSNGLFIDIPVKLLLWILPQIGNGTTTKDQRVQKQLGKWKL